MVGGEKRGKLKVFPELKFSADRSNGGPPLYLLRDKVHEYIESHPGVNTTVPQQLMADKQ